MKTHGEKSYVTIRHENISDYEQITEINTAAFEQTNESELIIALRKNPNFHEDLSFVACIDNKIVGHLLLFPIVIINNVSTKESLALAPMSVLPEYQNKGIGSSLITHAKEVARFFGYTSIIVLGHKDYYPKFGFKPANIWNIKAPFEVPDEVFMAIELKENALQHVSGTVEYPIEFESVS